ncbi:hypothetical protein B0O80DRAFT_422879 [Mortierella sp. GBAus27b]|nr:hypothetical protein B0O80DRAFT_422879 [Mortierella sp. GBAus27b]
MTTIPSGFTKAPAALKHLAGTGGPTLFNEKALDIWIGSNAFNQPLIIDGNAFQSTDSRIDKTIVGDRSSPECGRSTSLERGSSASSDLGNNFSDTNRMPTVTSGTIPTSAPMEIKKSRRRSSSKSVKSKPYPSTQIVSDVHQTGMESSNQLLAQNGSGNVPHQHHVPAGNDRTLPRQWMDGSNPSMSSVKLAPQESTRVPCVATGSAVLVDPEPQPPHYRVQPPASHRTFDRVDMNEGGHMDTLHQKLPTENPNTPDAQHARSNSCPPGFIERFESSFRITTGMANFNDSQTSTSGRRYSEPNMNDLTGAIIQSSSHQDVPYSTSQPAPVHTQQQCSSRQQQHALQFMAGSVQTGEMVLDMNSAESSIASSMHPFEMSLPGLEQDSLPTTPGISHGLITTTPIMSQSTCGPSSDGSYRGIPMAFGSQLASQRSSISPSPSPSPSPLASNNSCDHPRHLVSSDSNSSLLDSQPPPHAPLSVTPVAVGHTVGAPVLVRAHSLDSSAWQHPPPEDLNRFTDTNALVPIRRHSEGVPSASPTPMLLSQSQHTIVHQHQQQHHNSQHNQQQWERAQIKPSRNLNHFGYPLIQPFTPCDPNPFPLQIQAGHAPINNPCEPIHFQQPLAYTSHPMVPQPPPPFSLHTFLPDQTTQKPLISSLPNSPGLAQPTSSHAFASFPPTPFGAPTLKAAKGTDEDKRYM